MSKKYRAIPMTPARSPLVLPSALASLLAFLLNLSTLLLSSAPFLRPPSTPLPVLTRRHPDAPRRGAPRERPAPQTRQSRPSQDTRRPRNRGRSFSLALPERVGACPGRDPGVRVFRATNLGLRKSLQSATLHAAPAPSHPSSTHRTAPTARFAPLHPLLGERQNLS